MEKNALTRKVLLAPLADDRLTAAREEAWIEKSPKEPADRRREEEGSGKEGTEGSLRIFSDLLSSLREAVIITDGQGRLRHMNRKAQKLTGWSLPEATNRPLPEVFRIKEDLVCEISFFGATQFHFWEPPDFIVGIHFGASATNFSHSSMG